MEYSLENTQTNIILAPKEMEERQLKHRFYVLDEHGTMADEITRFKRIQMVLVKNKLGLAIFRAIIHTRASVGVLRAARPRGGRDVTLHSCSSEL